MVCLGTWVSDRGIQSFTHRSFTELSTSQGPGAALGAEDTAVNKTCGVYSCGGGGRGGVVLFPQIDGEK